MSSLDVSLLNDARALLAAFGREEVGKLVVQLRPGVELLLSRHAPVPTGTAVRAPHVGTLLECKAEGTPVEEGETVAVLDLLGERINVAAPVAGLINEAAAAGGELVQYGEPLVWLTGVRH